jgi:hypothetical protein
MSSIGRFGGGYVRVVKMNAWILFSKIAQVCSKSDSKGEMLFGKKLKNNTLFIWHKNWPIPYQMPSQCLQLL